MQRFSSAVTLIALIPALAMAQFPDAVRAGARVRVWLPEQYRQMDGPWRRLVLRGTVDTVLGDTLRLAVPGTGGSLAIPRATIRRLELSRGRPKRVPSAFERAIGGAIGGALALALENDPYGSEWPHYRRDWRAAEEGAKWGAAIGGAIGFLFPHEQWRRVRLKR